MTHRTFQWIFFDLDGTLADSIPAMRQVYLDFLNEFGITGTKEEFEELNGPSLSEIIILLQKKYRFDTDKNDLVVSYKNKIQGAYQNTVQPLVGASDLLQNVTRKGYKLLLVTSANDKIALEFIKRQKWEKFFQNYVFGNEIKKAKPHPDIYKLALKKADASPESVVVVEDSENGIKSAKGLDLFVIGLESNLSKNELIKAGADIVVSQLKEVLSILENKG